MKNFFEEEDRLYDINAVKAQYLINNIEHAFLMWEKPWARHLTFEEFCEYLLPHRVEHEPLQYWRDSIPTAFTGRLNWIEKIDEYYGSSFWACALLNDDLIEKHSSFMKATIKYTHPGFPDVNIHSWGCYELSYAGIFAMRSVGIPVAIDFIPQWADRRNPHYWNVVLTNNKQNIPFVGLDQSPTSRHKPDIKMAKIYRSTYANNKESLAHKQIEEPIPDFFENPFMRDVTDEYLNTTSFEIDLLTPPQVKRKIAYLCVFDNQDWSPVDWAVVKGNKTIFNNIGREIVCVVGYWINHGITPASLPFKIENNGSISYLKPHPTHTIDLTLNRKYPLHHRIVEYAERAIGTVIEASNDPEFSSIDTLHIMKENSFGFFQILDTPASKPYQFVRMKTTGQTPVPIAEFQVFGKDENQWLTGEIINSGRVNKGALEKRHICDGDLMTSLSIRNWTGFDFGEPVEITSIRFATGSDDNIVNPGEEYELFYWDGINIISLGIQQATGYYLSYSQVPAGTMFLLRNHTKGKQERIFTYENGRVVFW